MLVKKLAIKEQTEALVLSRHARYPSFALSDSISSLSQDISDLFSADAIVASIAANLSYLLFDGGQLRQNIKIQQLRLEQSLESYRSTLRWEEHTSELQSRPHLVCRLLLEKKQTKDYNH